MPYVIAIGIPVCVSVMVLFSAHAWLPFIDAALRYIDRHGKRDA